MASSTKATPSFLVRNICDSSAVIVTACASASGSVVDFGGQLAQQRDERVGGVLQLVRAAAHGQHTAARHAGDLGVHAADIPADHSRITLQETRALRKPSCG